MRVPGGRGQGRHLQGCPLGQALLGTQPSPGHTGHFERKKQPTQPVPSLSLTLLASNPVRSVQAFSTPDYYFIYFKK